MLSFFLLSFFLKVGKAVELIQHCLLSTNNKFQAIIDNVQVSIGYDYLQGRKTISCGQNVSLKPDLRRSLGSYPSCNRDQSFRNLSRQEDHRDMSNAQEMCQSTYFASVSSRGGEETFW
jgi:hypothetical protein